MLAWFRSAWFCRAQLLVSLQGLSCMPQRGGLSKLAPNPPLQRTRFAPRDRGYFRVSFRADVHPIRDSAPLNGIPVGQARCLFRCSKPVFTPHFYSPTSFPVASIFFLECSNSFPASSNSFLVTSLSFIDGPNSF